MNDISIKKMASQSHACYERTIAYPHHYANRYMTSIGTLTCAVLNDIACMHTMLLTIYKACHPSGLLQQVSVRSAHLQHMVGVWICTYDYDEDVHHVDLASTGMLSTQRSKKVWQDSQVYCIVLQVRSCAHRVAGVVECNPDGEAGDAHGQAGNGTAYQVRQQLAGLLNAQCQAYCCLCMPLQNLDPGGTHYLHRVEVTANCEIC